MPQKPFNFEASLNELEQITQWFESSDADLDAGLQKFERGLELAAALKEHLASVENQVEKIKARFGDSRKQAAPSQPFGGEETDLLD